MNKYRSIIPVICFLLMATACRNTTSKLKGEWHHIKEVTDANKNGTIDPNDSVKDQAGDELFIIFNSSGALIVSYNGTSNADDPGENKWSLVNDGTYLKITTKTDSTSGVTFLHIDELSSRKMILKDTSGGITTWNVWEKRE